MTTHEMSLLSTLSSADTVDTQIVALRTIKNYITGHELRKVEYIRSGLIPLLSKIVQQAQSKPLAQRSPISQEESLYTHATNIVGSLSYGGPSFIQPILCSNLITQLLSLLASTTSFRLMLAILRCLNVIADNLPLSSPDDWTPDRRLGNLIYTTSSNITCFARFISVASSVVISQQICDATLALICKTAITDAQKQLLVRAGVLAALGARLASFVVAEGLVVPAFGGMGTDTQDRNPIPTSAPSNAHLSPVLETVGILIDVSKSNSIELLSHPVIVAVLRLTSDDFSPVDIRKGPLGAPYLSGGAVPRSRAQTPLDLLLPHVPETSPPESADNFPPLGSNVVLPKRQPSSLQPSSHLPTSSTTEAHTEDQEYSLLVPWLLYIARTYRGKRRVLASRMLVTFKKFDLIPSVRIKSFQALLTPLLVQAIDQKPSDGNDKSFLLTKVTYYQAVPSVLARLIVDDERLQKVAVDGKAIAKLAACLKTTFEPPIEKASLWKPWRQSSPVQGASPDCSLGTGGPSLDERHVMLHREGLLQALAAIAPFNDHYRKEICDQGVLAQIMLALEPFHSEATIKNGQDSSLTTSGNSASTLLAACDAVRALTRSVTALRTKLVDADVGKAIVKLLHSTDPEVTIAATKVIANLAIDFSPMKPTVSEPALVKKLCEQAHSANARLRLESIWALKHLVLKSSNKLKRDVIDELGANWMRHLIATDPYDIPPGEVIGLVEKEYPPFSASRVSAGDVIMSDDSDDDEAVAIDTIRDQSEYTKHTTDDDLAIQEQLLDLLRNLFCGDNSSEVVEYFLSEIGYQEFMKILMDRLRPRTISGPTRKANQISSAPPGIVTATLNVIVHLAACQPKFRDMITVNTTLLRQILAFHQNPDRRIRAAVCWIAINLTYGDNPAEREQCRIRALEMNKAGYLSFMRRMESDPELDVKERAKTAVVLLEKLIPKEIQR